MDLNEDYEKIEEAFKKWLVEPYGEFGLRVECIDKASLGFIKQAFFDGHKLGYENRKARNYEEWNQK